MLSLWRGLSDEHVAARLQAQAIREEAFECVRQVAQAHVQCDRNAVLSLEAANSRTSALTQQQVDDFVAVGAQSQVHRRVLVVVLGVHVRALLQQVGDHLSVTVL